MPVANRIYVSYSDVQSATDVEALRINHRLMTDISTIPSKKRRKILDRIIGYARQNPMAVTPILLRHFQTKNSGLKADIKTAIEMILTFPGGNSALKESLLSAHAEVADSAAEILDDRDLLGRRFRDLYAASEEIFYQCKELEIYTSDVEELVIEAIRLYKEEALELAFENIILGHDLLQDRVDWNTSLRRYIQDVLKLAPELIQSGAQIDNIQESLKTLSQAIKSRDYIETRVLVEQRKLEGAITRELSSALTFISKRVKELDEDAPDQIDEEYKGIFDGMKNMHKELFDFLDQDKMLDALKSLYIFITRDFTRNFIGDISDRIDSGDQKAIFACREAATGMLKITSAVIPTVASELYDSYLRELKEKDTIDEVSWPIPLRGLARRKRKTGKTKKKKK